MTSSGRGRGSLIRRSSTTRPGPRSHDQDPVGEEDRLRDRVGDEEDGLLLLHPDALQLEVHVLAGHGVERPEGLVHQEHGRVVDEGAGDRDALLHATGQLPRIPALELAQADQGEQVHRRGHEALPAQALHVDGQEHVVEDGAPREEDRGLEDHADVPARALDGGAAEGRAPGGGRQQAGEDLEQGGLAAAGGPDHRHELALVHGEADPLEGGDAAVPRRVELRQLLDRDRFRGHFAGSLHRNGRALPKLLLDPTRRAADRARGGSRTARGRRRGRPGRGRRGPFPAGPPGRSGSPRAPARTRPSPGPRGRR